VALVSIRAILFDAAGTLIYLPRGVGWHYREIAARHGITVDEKRLGAAFGAAFKGAGPRGRGEIGIARPEDDKTWWRGVAGRVFAECGAEPGEGVFGPMFEELYGHFAEPGVWALYPEVMGVLEALHGRYRLGVVSNFDRRLYPVLEELGVGRYFEKILVSSELGVDKPDPRVFAAALTGLGIEAGEAVHVGDEPEQDWRGAEEAGLHVYRVERPERGLEGVPEFVRGII
jgi:putative hydrolase of the HAD superfamily